MTTGSLEPPTIRRDRAEFGTNAARVKHRSHLHELIEPVIRSKSSAHWRERLQAQECHVQVGHVQGAAQNRQRRAVSLSYLDNHSAMLDLGGRRKRPAYH